MSNLSKNILYNFSGQIVVVFLGFIAVKYIFSQLGEDALGIIYFTAMMNGLLCTVLEMGICSTTVREVSAHFDSEPEYIRDLIRTFSLFYWGSFALIGTAIYFAAPLIVEKWINLKSMESATAICAIRILGTSSLVALPGSFYVSLFRGLQRMEFNNIIDVGTIGAQQLGAILLLSLHDGLFSLIYWFAFCYVLRVCIYVVFARQFFSLKALVPGFSKQTVKRVISFASSMMSLSVLATIHMQMDKIIVSKLLPVGIFGYYGFTYGSISRGSLIAGAIQHASYPSFSALHEKGDELNLLAQYQKAQDFTCFFLLPLYAAIPFVSIPLLTYLFNQETADLLLLPSTFLGLGFYMNATLAIPSALSQAVGKPGIMLRMNFYALFAVLPATMILTHTFGLAGAAFSWVFYHLFAYAFAVPRICDECLGIPAWKWYWHAMRVFLLAGVSFGGAWLIWNAAGDPSIFSVILAYLSASVAFLVGSLFLLGSQLRETLSWYQRKIFARSMIGS